jgi:hypothetical protein
MSINNITSVLYKTASLLRDVNALMKGKLISRTTNKFIMHIVNKFIIK